MQKGPMRVLLVVLALSGCLLTVRLMTLCSTDAYEKTAKAQSVREETLASERGIFYDRNGLPLQAHSTVHFYVANPCVTTSQQVKSCGLPLTDETIARAFAACTPLVCSTKLPYPIENKPAQGWLTADVALTDAHDDTALHLLGSVRDGVGTSGLQKCFNPLLSKGGDRLTLTWPANAKGGIREGCIPVLSQTKDASGVLLTIDRSIQRLCQEQLAVYGKPSAAVVTDSATGEILAMASYPTWDPANPAAALSNQDSPFLNRCLQSYDAGSIFKIVTTATALENGISLNQTHLCDGAYTVGETSIACSNKSGHGRITLTKAFYESCNPYFCALGQQVGAAPLLAMAKAMGLGNYVQLCPVTAWSPTALCDTGGHLPDISELQEKAALALFAFGQGQLQVTPIQMAAVVSTVASGGVYHAPRLILGLADQNAKGYQPDDTSFSGSAGVRVLQQKTASTLLSLLTGVVEQGSGLHAKSELFGTCGKTGTAETGWVEDGESKVHGWFVGCFPSDKPKYTVVVFCENGKTGAGAAAPIFLNIAEGIWQLKG